MDRATIHNARNVSIERLVNRARRYIASLAHATTAHQLTNTPGVTFDTVLSLLKYTAFDPRKTLPLYLAALYTDKGREFAFQHPAVLKWLRRAVFGGLFFRAKKFLDDGVGNNWKNDRYNWSREIVVVTGGSDGIGAKIVSMLASKGIKTVILDIQAPKFVRMYTPPNHLRVASDWSNVL